MSSAPAGFAKVYGSHPFHLLLMTAGFAVVIAVVATMKPASLWNPASWWQSIAVWFVVAIIAHDLLAFPLYALVGRLMERGLRRRATSRVPVLNYVRLPAMAAALTFLLFLPGIIEQGGPAYLAATGQTQEPFLTRWLWLTAGFFIAGAAAYCVALVIDRRRGQQPEAGDAQTTA